MTVITDRVDAVRHFAAKSTARFTPTSGGPASEARGETPGSRIVPLGPRFGQHEAPRDLKVASDEGGHLWKDFCDRLV